MKPLRYQRVRNRSRRRGAFVVLMCVMLVVVFAMISFVVDLGNVIVNKTTLGAAADAAALAAASSMAEDLSYSEMQAIGREYALMNVPANYGAVADDASVIFGNWDPATRTFTPSNIAPDAVRVVVARTESRGNPVPYFFARALGQDWTEVSAEAIAVGPVSTAGTNTAPGAQSVYVTSTKDLSNVVLGFEDGEHQKFEGLSGYSATFEGTGEHAGKAIACVWIKSGCNSSGEGPGYGERLDNPSNETTMHGQSNQGCTPHVTATFESTGVDFTETGAPGPVRLVY